MAQLHRFVHRLILLTAVAGALMLSPVLPLTAQAAWQGGGGGWQGGGGGWHGGGGGWHGGGCCWGGGFASNSLSLISDTNLRRAGIAASVKRTSRSGCAR